MLEWEFKQEITATNDGMPQLWAKYYTTVVQLLSKVYTPEEWRETTNYIGVDGFRRDMYYWFYKEAKNEDFIK
jgi:hypothetical protein